MVFCFFFVSFIYVLFFAMVAMANRCKLLCDNGLLCHSNPVLLWHLPWQAYKVLWNKGLQQRRGVVLKFICYGNIFGRW